MITKREKLQYGYLFLIDLLSLVLSIGLAWGLPQVFCTRWETSSWTIW